MSQIEISPAGNEGASVQPHDRQILVSFGNRYVVFGSGASLPDQRQLGPQDVKQKLPRVRDERDGVEARIVDSLVVDGLVVRRVEDGKFGDVVIVDGDGRSALVEIKAGDRAFAGMDLAQAWEELAPAADVGERREIWAFNLERLSLGIVWSEGRLSPRFEQLSALNVWEFNQDGTVFDRHTLLQELDDWSRRVEAVYADVEAWVREDGLTATRDRTVPMSEELMQRFAVPDRDMPILDVTAGPKPIVSMVPAGLWFIGFAGLIDVITQTGTFKLGARPRVPGPSTWVLSRPGSRDQREWSKEEFKSLLGLVPAHE